jgi:hypothetical protein
LNAALMRGARRRGIGKQRGAKARAVRTTLTISSMISRLRTGSTPILGLGGSIAIVRFEVAHGTLSAEKKKFELANAHDTKIYEKQFPVL